MKLKNRNDIHLFNKFGNTLQRLELIGFVRASVRRVYGSYPAEDYGYDEGWQESVIVQVSDNDIGYVEYDM